MEFVKLNRKELFICGLVGIAGKLELKDEKAMKRLLLIDYLRGPDSTGMAVRNKNTGDVSVLKMASHPFDFFESKKFTTMLSAYASDVFLGHNRLATKGKVNGLNAHPFECGHIIGAHNGTLETGSWKELNELIEEDTEVDSKAIFLAIEKFGIEKTMEHMYGAWALVWIDTNEGTLNFLRNSKRPLSYSYNEDRTKLMWASEYPMMQVATDLSETKYELWVNPEGYSYFDFEEDRLYTFDLKKLADSTVKVKDRKPKSKELKGKEPPVAYTPPSNFTVCTTERHGKTGSQTRITLTGTVTDPFAGVIAIDKFKELSRYGCSYCDGEIKFDDVGLSVYTDTDQILCRTCNGGTRSETRIFMCHDDFNFMKQALV